MGLIDDMKAKAQDVMNDPEKKAKIKQMADEKGITIEQAKRHFLKMNDSNNK